MKSQLLILIALAGCNAATNDKAATAKPAIASQVKAPPAPIAAQVENAGDCMLVNCTMHFAQAFAGDARTFTTTERSRASRDGHRRTGKLSDLALARMQSLAARMEAEKLLPVYGEPGGADGPVDTLVLHHADGSETTHALDPMHPNEFPACLKDASDLLHSVSDSLSECETSELITPDADCKNRPVIEIGAIP